MLSFPTIDGDYRSHAETPIARPKLLPPPCWAGPPFSTPMWQAASRQSTEPVLAGQESVTEQLSDTPTKARRLLVRKFLNVAPLVTLLPGNWSYRNLQSLSQDVFSVGGQAPHGHRRHQAHRVQARGGGDYINAVVGGYSDTPRYFDECQ